MITTIIMVKGTSKITWSPSKINFGSQGRDTLQVQGPVIEG
jgi:hypothetical protein